MTFGAVTCSPLLRFQLDDCLAKFLLPSGDSCDLVFDVQVRDGVSFSPGRVLFAGNGVYAVGLEDDGCFLFRSWTRLGPARIARVQPDFSGGTVYVPTAVATEGAFYPLQEIDMVMAINWLALAGDFMIHSAAINDNGAGYLFIGPSGAGKSTMADLWVRVPDTLVLGEDQNVVCWQQDRFWLYGSPWHQNPDRCMPGGVPLRGIFLLEHGSRTVARELLGAEAVSSILVNCDLPIYRHGALRSILGSLDELRQRVPVYHLTFQPDLDVVDYVRRLQLA